MPPRNAEGSFCRYYYGKLKRSYTSVKEAKEELGIGQRIRGHCCRAVKKVGGTTRMRFTHAKKPTKFERSNTETLRRGQRGFPRGQGSFPRSQGGNRSKGPGQPSNGAREVFEGPTQPSGGRADPSTGPGQLSKGPGKTLEHEQGVMQYTIA